MNRQQRGRWGEQRAAEALERAGFRIVARNWRCAEGEVDLVAEREGALYFVEVRTRRGEALGTPEDSLIPAKRARMEAVARRYLGEVAPPEVVSWHLAFVAVALDGRGRLRRLTFYPDLEGEPWPDFR